MAIYWSMPTNKLTPDLIVGKRLVWSSEAKYLDAVNNLRLNPEIEFTGLFVSSFFETLDDTGQVIRVKAENVPHYREVTHRGAVVALGGVNVGDDYDEFAIVWDGVNLSTYTYSSSRWASNSYAEVDAFTDEQKALIEEAFAKRLFAAHIRWQRQMYINRPPKRGDLLTFAVRYKPRKGDHAGHQFNVGDQMRLFWLGEDAGYGVPVGLGRDDDYDAEARKYTKVLFTTLDKFAREEFVPNFGEAQRYAEENKSNFAEHAIDLYKGRV